MIVRGGHARGRVARSASSPTGCPTGSCTSPGGPARFLEVLRDQLTPPGRHSARRRSSADGRWSSTGSIPTPAQSHEALLTIADGLIGTNGAPLFAHPGRASRAVGGRRLRRRRAAHRPARRAAVGDARRTRSASGDRVRRALDLRTGRARRRCRRATPRCDSVRFSSLARPGRRGAPSRCRPARRRPTRSSVRTARHRPASTTARCGARRGARRLDHRRGVAATRRHPARSSRVVRRRRRAPPIRIARGAGLAAARADGFDRLLADHRRTWARRWERADIRIDGDDAAPARRTSRALPLDGVGRPAGRGRGRCPRDDRARLSRPRVLGRRAVRAPVPRRDRAGGGPGDARVPGATGCRRRSPRRGPRAGAARGSRGSRPRPASTSRPEPGTIRPARSCRSAPGEAEVHIVGDVAWAACCYIDWTTTRSSRLGAGPDAARSRPRATGRRAFASTAPGARTSTASSGPTSTTSPSTTTRSRTCSRAGTSGARPPPRSRSTTVQCRPTSCETWHRLADALVDGFDPATRRVRGVRRLLRSRADARPRRRASPPGHRRSGARARSACIARRS